MVNKVRKEDRAGGGNQVSSNINCTDGQTLIGAVLALPAQDESLVEAVTQYLFGANYDPWEFKHDWRPVVTGIQYPLAK